MRILHVNKFLYRRGGAEGYMEDVAALQRAAGHEVAFWGMAHPENTHRELEATFPSQVDFEQPPPGLRGRAKVVGRMLWSTSARKGIERAIDEVRPDVVHCHNIYHQLSPSIFGPVADRGIPLVMTLHDYKLVCPTFQFLDNGELCEACLPRRLWEAPKRRCRNHSLLASGTMALELSVHRLAHLYAPVKVFICPSRFLATQMARGKVYPDRMHVLNHFAEIGDIAVKAEAGGNVVLAGRLAVEKGVDVAIRAIALTDEPLHLDIAGDGPVRAELEALAAEVAPGRVTFHGRLAKDDLFALLRRSVAALVPSLWFENQPMAVIEAFANGVPVIASDLGGLPELVEPGVSGALVPHGDAKALAVAMAELASDPDRALALGQAGRARIERDFAPSVHLDGLDRLYRLAGGR